MTSAVRRPWLEIARSGAVAVRLHPLSSVVTVACVAAVLVPFTAALGISRGFAVEAARAVDASATVHVTGEVLGRGAGLPASAADMVRQVPGVTAVSPRIVGSALLGADPMEVLVVGVSAARAPDGSELVEGNLFRPGHSYEVILGTELAAHLRLRVGDAIPPFYRNPRGERVVRVVGLLRGGLPVWQSRALVTTYDTAADILASEGLATSLEVECREGYEGSVREAILHLESLNPPGAPTLRPRVVTRTQLRALLHRRTTDREGTFALVHLLAFAVGIPLVLATTGLGLAERRREVGLLKALGWRTDEVVSRSLVESLVLATLGTSLALCIVWAWVRLVGAGLATRLFLPASDVPFLADVPFDLAPGPLLLTVAAAFVVTASGSLLSAWRAASAEPAEAIR